MEQEFPGHKTRKVQVSESLSEGIRNCIIVRNVKKRSNIGMSCILNYFLNYFSTLLTLSPSFSNLFQETLFSVQKTTRYASVAIKLIRFPTTLNSESTASRFQNQGSSLPLTILLEGQSSSPRGLRGV
ncbi:hypothetical protein TNCV_3729091 [Trichonephila clavipes]|nr:hypothetical protein TNCV_3729091 [Trichonephila clavipes]